MRKILLILFLATPVLGQTVSITDATASGSPVTLRGTVAFDPTNPSNVTCDVTGHNNANKTIVAFTLLFTVVKNNMPTSGGTAHDHFFKDLTTMMAQIANPASDFDPMLDCPGFFGGREKDYGNTQYPQQQSPSVSLGFYFIQFDDGSFWGNPSAVMFQRTDTINYFTSLQTAYKSGGPGALTQALSAAVPFRDPQGKRRFMVYQERAQLQQLSDMNAAAKQIDQELAMAQAHASWMH